MTDRIFGSLMVLLAAFFIWAAFQIQLSFITDPLGPRAFPIIIGVVLGLCGLVVLLKPDPEPEWPQLSRMLEIAAATIVFLAYGQLLPELGFLICTFFAGGYLAWRLGCGWLEAIVAGAGTSIGIYVVFHLILGLSLARGPFGF
ncbi:tripartite tricarboxylate transporter TctB family protein [Fulvimarina sp. 2208YS6-2-32]|uniref:Tripartite tricarboxylate transporter TctB family protein n=1 Tax=Fulvimarina uroteuthidis TaxID=3098149 RepID=A0ABU5I3C3_9HYPH|nr:tripartite tricarboxylate transporter TctB family protein [Fulvimarina sp. 2208YS6-2-32]MDY8108681.1 tripartite tricarboxylate transporter TctB family protein [Fulvimarina sp. 2208YS6-2-32]